jgi:hypothetical protein
MGGDFERVSVWVVEVERPRQLMIDRSDRATEDAGKVGLPRKKLCG